MITGPHSLTQREQVITIGDVIGRTLRFEEITPDDARRELGFRRAAIDMLLNAWSAAPGLPAYVTTTVAEVTGTAARTFAEWARSNKQAFVRPCGLLSASPSRLDGGNVDFLHGHHRCECTLCLIATCRECVGQRARGDLPGEAPTVLAPATCVSSPPLLTIAFQ